MTGDRKIKVMGVKDTTESSGVQVDYGALLKEMMACKNVAGLELKFGNRSALKEDYENRKKETPDFDLFIKSEIAHLNSKIAGDTTGSVQFGFAYITSGKVNTTLETLLPGLIKKFIKQQAKQEKVVGKIDEEKLENSNLIRYACLQQFANGASIAFHLGFLKKELPLAQNGKSIQKRANATGTEITSFDNLFIDSQDIEKCMAILRLADPRLLKSNDDSNGKNKSAFCIWVQKMHNYGIIKFQNDPGYTNLLNKKFPSLNMTKDGSLFRKISKKANDEYLFHFDTELKKLKK